MLIVRTRLETASYYLCDLPTELIIYRYAYYSYTFRTNKIIY